MDREEFRKRGREVIDFLIEYNKTVSQGQIMSTQRSGYLRDVLPDSAPVKPERWDKIMDDIKNCIMPGIVHWRHSKYFAYFPCGGSFPSILADMLISTINSSCFSWGASPACMELEIITLDWLAKMLGLPDIFYHSNEENGGGGIFQVTCTDALLVTMIAARFAKAKSLNQRNPTLDRRSYLPFFVAYCSKIAYTSIVKIAEVAMIQIRLLAVDEKMQLRGQTLEKAIEEDKAKGLIPFFAYASLGTSSFCSCDAVYEIGPVCLKFGIWLHVDGAYAGSALICPEFRYLLKGIEFADSFSIDPSMWMLMNFDCCAMWVQDRDKITNAFVVDPLYLHQTSSEESMDYRHWGVPLSRRFRALKLWFVIRTYGVQGLQDHIRNHVRLAKLFEKHLLSDKRFVVENEAIFGIVCFRLKGSNSANVHLLSKINDTGKIFLVGAMIEERYVIRFCVCSDNAIEEDITFAWEVIKKITDKIYSQTDI